MNAIEILALALIGIVTSLVGGILRDDARTYIPKLAHKLIFLAARRLPPAEEVLYAEAWLSHLAELEERTAMLKHALQCYFMAAPRLSAELSAAPTMYTKKIKRCIEFIIALSLLPIVVLAFVVLIPFAALERRPVLFCQRRVGRCGRTFWIYKFVTLDSASLQPTPLGRLLRWLRVDELPQIINVLRGEMSLVGPRPDHVDL